MLRRTRSLQVTTNIALIVASVAVAGNSSFELYSRLHSAAAPPRVTTAARPERIPFPPGAKAPVVPGIDYGSSYRTLVMFISTHCKYCEMSLPFYRELNGRLGSNGAGRHMVAVFPQTAAEVKTFKEREKLDIDTVAAMELNEFGVSGTPTLVLVARDGSVIKSWVGAPADPVKEAISSAFLRG